MSITATPTSIAAAALPDCFAGAVAHAAATARQQKMAKRRAVANNSIATESSQARSESKVQVARQSLALFLERLCQQRHPPFGFRQVRVVEIQVQQVDVPRQLLLAGDVGLH